jgi:hypothetical protein
MGRKLVSGSQKNVKLNVYFDTNIVRDLAERRIADATQKLAFLKEKACHNRLTICPSIDVFSELAFVLVNDQPQKFGKLVKSYRSLVNWDYMLKPHNEMLNDDIVSFANQGKRANPFMRSDNKCYWFVEKMKAGDTVFSESRLRELAQEEMDRRPRFLQRVLAPHQKTRLDEIRARIRNTKADEEKEWEGLWKPNSAAEIIISAFAERHQGILEKCQERGLQLLLSIPTIRLFIGYILHNWHRQVVTESNPREGDVGDFSHAICAGAVGQIVTSDKRLRQAIKHIPNHSIRACTLDELIKHF